MSDKLKHRIRDFVFLSIKVTGNTPMISAVYYDLFRMIVANGFHGCCEIQVFFRSSWKIVAADKAEKWRGIFSYVVRWGKFVDYGPRFGDAPLFTDRGLCDHLPGDRHEACNLKLG